MPQDIQNPIIDQYVMGLSHPFHRRIAIKLLRIPNTPNTPQELETIQRTTSHTALRYVSYQIESLRTNLDLDYNQVQKILLERLAIDLPLELVELFDRDELIQGEDKFTRCRVHKDEKLDGVPFQYEITITQAMLLSRLIDAPPDKILSPLETKILFGEIGTEDLGVPKILRTITNPHPESRFIGVIPSLHAKAALYDLLK